MIFHENRLPADDSHEISRRYDISWESSASRRFAWNIMPYLLFLKKAAKFEIVICCKLQVALYGLTWIKFLQFTKWKASKWCHNHHHICGIGIEWVLTLKAPPIICSRRQFQNLPLFSKITNKACNFVRIVCWQTILMKYHILFFLKIKKDVAKFVVCCSRVWRCKG